MCGLVILRAVLSAAKHFWHGLPGQTDWGVKIQTNRIQKTSMDKRIKENHYQETGTCVQSKGPVPGLPGFGFSQV